MSQERKIDEIFGRPIDYELTITVLAPDMTGKQGLILKGVADTDTILKILVNAMGSALIAKDKAKAKAIKPSVLLVGGN